MNIDGIWSVEMVGLYGWERIGTAFLENGRYLAASADHYSIGSYEKGKSTFRAKIQINQYGTARAVYGSKKRELETIIEGKIKKKGKIIGKARPLTGGNFDITLRLTRLAKLD